MQLIIHYQIKREMIKQYFTKKRILQILFSKNISRLALIDSTSKIFTKARINRFVKISNSKIDDYTYIGPNSELTNCEIGKFCSISSKVIIGLGIHPIDYLSTSPIFFSPHNGTGIQWAKEKTFEDYPQKTIIGNDVWIGVNAIIMGGLKIGNGAIIAANAVVTKNVESYSIVAGIPAKAIRKRFDDEIIERLCKLKWWNFSETVLKNNLNILNNPLNKEILNFLENYSEDQS